MKTVYETGGPNPAKPDQQMIKVEQSDGLGKLFKVTYSQQVKNHLTYDQACSAIGACILHMLVCNGTVDNEGL